MHMAACCQKKKESKAALHFILRLKKKTLHRWKSYVLCLQTKKKSQGQNIPIPLMYNNCLFTVLNSITQLSLTLPFLSPLAVAQLACHFRLMMIGWRKWRGALQRKQGQEDRLQAAGHLAIQSTQRRALERWRACILIQT